jgi:hypothetical protein
MRGRPALTTAFATAIMAAALLVVPVSYQQTVGHEVLLTVSGPSMDDAAAGRVAREVKSALDADNVTLAAVPAEPAMKMITLGTSSSAPDTPPSQDISFSSQAKSSYTFKARVASPSRANVEAATAALARILAERGMDAEFGVTVVRQEVSGNVYAMALDKVLQIRVDSEGKHVDEIAAEIRAHLEEAGMPNPEVTVSEDGNMMKICVKACGDEMPCEELPEFNISVDGMDMDSPNARKIAVRRTPEMTDADVIAEVQRQLREQGVDAEVTIVDGRIEIEIND